MKYSEKRSFTVYAYLKAVFAAAIGGSTEQLIMVGPQPLRNMRDLG